MKDAFEAAGLKPKDNQRQIWKTWAMEAERQGATREDWIATWDERAMRTPMPGGGQTPNAQQGHAANAPVRQPDASGEGHLIVAPEGHQTDAPSARSPMTEGGHTSAVGNDPRSPAPLRHPIASGHGSAAQQGHVGIAARDLASGKATSSAPNRASAAVPPAREPSAADLAAMSKVENIGFSEIVKIRGKLLGRYSFGQLKNARAMNLYENLIIQELQEWRKDKKVSDDMLIERAVPEAELKKIVERCKRAIHSNARMANG